MFSMFVKNRDTNKMEIEYKDIKKDANDLTVSKIMSVTLLL